MRLQDVAPGVGAGEHVAGGFVPGPVGVRGLVLRVGVGVRCGDAPGATVPGAGVPVAAFLCEHRQQCGREGRRPHLHRVVARRKGIAPAGRMPAGRRYDIAAVALDVHARP